MDNTIKTGEGQESTDNYQLSIASCPLKRIALFPGTFDPFTIGHESLVSRGLELVDEIIIRSVSTTRSEPIFHWRNGWRRSKSSTRTNRAYGSCRTTP